MDAVGDGAWGTVPRPGGSRRGLVVAVVLMALGTAACGSTHRATAPATTTSPPRAAPTSSGATHRTSATSVPTSSGATGPVASSGSTAPSVATCAATALAGTVEGIEGGAGTIELTVTVTNRGSTPCSLDGYPGISLLASDGASVPVAVQPGGPLAFEQVAPSVVVLASGQRAEVNLGISDVPAAGEPTCPTVTTVAVTPPGAQTPVDVATDVQVCSGHDVDVSAVYAASGKAAATAAPPASG